MFRLVRTRDTAGLKLASAGIAVCLIALCLVFAGRGLYLYAKANLAQFLIADAWRQTLQTGEPTKPWQWADTWPVAKMVLADEELYVLQGATGRVMAFGPGHVNGTAEPEQFGNVAIGGHRDTHFAALEDVQPGDVIAMQTKDAPRQYQVAETHIVDANDTRWLAQQGDDRLTLITCYPFDGIAGQATERYVVVAYPM